MYCHLEGHWQKEQDPDPEVSGRDPRDPDWIRIRTIMSRIHNTAKQTIRYHMEEKLFLSYLCPDITVRTFTQAFLMTSIYCRERKRESRDEDKYLEEGNGEEINKTGNSR